MKTWFKKVLEDSTRFSYFFCCVYEGFFISTRIPYFFCLEPKFPPCLCNYNIKIIQIGWFTIKLFVIFYFVTKEFNTIRATQNETADRHEFFAKNEIAKGQCARPWVWDKERISISVDAFPLKTTWSPQLWRGKKLSWVELFIICLSFDWSYTLILDIKVIYS